MTKQNLPLWIIAGVLSLFLLILVSWWVNGQIQEEQRRDDLMRRQPWRWHYSEADRYKE